MFQTPKNVSTQPINIVPSHKQKREGPTPEALEHLRGRSRQIQAQFAQQN